MSRSPDRSTPDATMAMRRMHRGRAGRASRDHAFNAWPSVTRDCLFCDPPASQLFYEDEIVVGLWDRFPVSPGHALLLPRRHVETWFQATAEERVALVAAIDATKRAIEHLHRPDGYNIGINIGEAAGQTVFHLHVHVI